MKEITCTSFGLKIKTWKRLKDLPPHGWKSSTVQLLGLLDGSHCKKNMTNECNSLIPFSNIFWKIIFTSFAMLNQILNIILRIKEIEIYIYFIWTWKEKKKKCKPGKILVGQWMWCLNQSTLCRAPPLCLPENLSEFAMPLKWTSTGLQSCYMSTLLLHNSWEECWHPSLLYPHTHVKERNKAANLYSRCPPPSKQKSSWKNIAVTSSLGSTQSNGHQADILHKQQLCRQGPRGYSG